MSVKVTGRGSVPPLRHIRCVEISANVLTYSAEVKCETNTVCKDGYCIKSYAGQECTAIGAKKCGELNNVLTCGDYNNDGCL